ncbi:unnamed protein product [Allacma fusca]|uniref:Constitutive coactivator of PPAR-gamma-like protein 1 n=1 Tax=Allacma fusca TaxID=39272 RepID=A0A8J2JLV7_9HEXA|nr:unnamed protein product [Allacma fusca]
MGLSDLQSHIVQAIPDAAALVDLLQIAKERTKREGPLKLVVDGECCLDRLYGGFYPDWVCGGQWDKMEQFLRNFSLVIQSSNLDLVIFFNGTTEIERVGGGHSRYRYEETYRFLEEITKHVTLKKKPPPKIWWIPPAYLRSAIRQTFRLLDVKVMCTIEDHHKDIVRFCQKNKFHGIVADNPEYLLIESHRYFSAQKLKLTFKGSLETVETKLKKVYETLNVPKERIFIFSALLGNHILTEGDLKEFYTSLGVELSQSKETVIEKVAQFTRELESKDADKIAALVVAKSRKSESEDEIQKNQILAGKIIKCLQYYQDVKAPSQTNNKNRNKKPKKEKAQKNQAATKPSEKSEDPVKTADLLKEQTVGNCKLEISPSPSLPNGTANGVTEKQQPESAVGKLAFRINPQVEEVATSRHKAGVMSPYICQIIKQKEIRLPLLIEDIRPVSADVPRAHELFRPLRQRVYAILFNLHHIHYLAKKSGEKPAHIQVNENYYCTRTKSVKTLTVNAVEVGWAIPTVEKLWLGEGEDCKNKRIRAFLSLMKSENRSVVDPDYVPQQMVILAAVLRYILQSDKKLIRKQELDAFVAQAFIQDMTDANLAQDIEVTNLTMRGVHLSHVFMEGVEMALLANDACGAPIPFMLFCPWLFFNGKIFNYVLEQQAEGKGLTDICGYKADLLYSIEQLTVAILDGIKNPFAPNPAPQLFVPGKGLATGLMNPLLPHGPQSRISYSGSQQMYGTGYGSGNAILCQYSAAGYTPARSRGNNSYGVVLAGAHPQLHPNYGGHLVGGASNHGQIPGAASRGLFPLYNNNDPGRQRRVQSRGGQLEVAGMVVGSWGANYGPTGHLTNGSANFGSQRMVRNSLLAGEPRNARMATLIHPMRISGVHVNKVSNVRGNGNHWAQKRGTRPAKKSIMKKPETIKEDNAQPSADNSSPGTANKTKGVTFKEEESKNTATKTEVGAGDARITEDIARLSIAIENGSGEVNESSPVTTEQARDDTCTPASQRVELKM